MKIYNAALIGCGILGLRRTKLFKNKFKLIACADSNKLKLNKFSKKLFLTNNWSDLLKLKNLDAVFVATYHSDQSEIIKRFVKKKIHVFCEKPGGVSALKTKQIINICKKYKNINIKFGYNHRFHPAFILAKKLISNNSIGKILYLRAIYGHGGRKNYEKEWRFKKKLSGGGELIDKGSHLIDLSRLFLGKLDVYSSYLKTYFWNTKLEDNCFLTLKNEKNNLAFLHASSTEWKNKFVFEIFCKFGKLEIIGLGKSYGKQSLTVYKMSKNMGIPKKKIFNFPKSLIDKAWKIEVEDFYNSILKSKKSNPNIKDVYENLKIINKIYKK